MRQAKQMELLERIKLNATHLHKGDKITINYLEEVTKEILAQIEKNYTGDNKFLIYGGLSEFFTPTLRSVLLKNKQHIPITYMPNKEKPKHLTNYEIINTSPYAQKLNEMINPVKKAA